MSPLFATSYTLGDGILMLSLMALPSLFILVTFGSMVVTWRRRREAGFLWVAIGGGLQALTVCVPALFMWNGRDFWTEARGFLWFLQLAPAVSTIGWLMLASRKPATAAGNQR